jgi:hypothetical protein
MRKPTAYSDAHIIGPEAGTLIAEVVLAMEFGGFNGGRYRPHLPCAPDA